MEKMFLDATNKTEDSATNLQKMITGVMILVLYNI